MALLSAMAPAGGGRQELPARFLRHFHVLAYPDLDKETLGYVFETIMKTTWRKMGDTAKVEIKALVNATIDFYTNIRKQLLPIPGRTHY